MHKIKILFLSAIFLTISCDSNSDSDSDGPVTTNSTIIQSVKINVPIGPVNSTTTYLEFDYSPLNQHINNSYIQSVDVNSVSYRFKNLNQTDDIILDSYSISFNALEIDNITTETNLQQAINENTIFQIDNQELFDWLEESILINSNVSVSSYGTYQYSGMPNSFEIEVTINVDVTTEF